MLDPTIVVSIGGASPSVIEREARIPWSEFAARLTAEPPESMDKASRGWYACTEFNPIYRHSENFVARHCLTYDFDQIKREDFPKIVAGLKGLTYAIYTTFSHKPETPRLRVVVPLSRGATLDEFQAVSRKIAENFGIELAARESHVPAQMMYLPVKYPGALFKANVQAGAPVDVDFVLAEYADWRDRTSWPHRAEGDGVHADTSNIQPPTEKPGIVGDFCRALDIYAAIERFNLPYTPTGTPDRLTFTLGSRPEGAVVYDDATKLHSHHDTDPARGQHNAFDLVRLHKFGEQDAGVDPATPITERPSYRAMCELALEQPELRRALVEDFEVVPVDGATPPPSEGTEAGDAVRAMVNGADSFKTPPTRFAFKRVGEFLRGETPGWLIKYHWPAQSFVLEIGESGAGKTFSVLDKCLAIARGLPEWRGFRVRKARVAYVAAEGSGGFRNRVRAYEIENSVQLDEHNFRVLDAAPNLYGSAADQAGLIAALEAIGGADLVVMDTVAATSPGANENTSDMLNVINFYTKLIAHFGCTVVGIHHLGKDASRGARGFSGIKAAADAEITTENEAGVRTVYVSKMKDGAEGDKYHFKLKSVDIALDTDGDRITSCVVDYEAAPAHHASDRRPSGGARKRVYELLLELGARVEPVPVDTVIAAAQSKYTVDQAKPSRIRKTINDLIAESFVMKTTSKAGLEQVALYGGVVVDEENDNE